MSDTKWTPGPWEVHPLAPYAAHQPEFSCWIPQDKHDAHLIAAAPDGYALAEMVMDICGNPRGISEASQEELYEAALQYTKKARGES